MNPKQVRSFGVHVRTVPVARLKSCPDEKPDTQLRLIGTVTAGVEDLDDRLRVEFRLNLRQWMLNTAIALVEMGTEDINEGGERKGFGFECVEG